VLVEQCFHALDHDRLEFHDPTGQCAVASTGAAAMGLGVCILTAPEIIVGAVIVTGIVVVGFAIKEALDAYELDMGHPEVRPVLETKPAPQEPSPKKRPKPEPKEPDFPPLGPIETSERERRPDCKPIPVPHRGGDDGHNLCADKIPNNNFAGWDVLVNGKNFDALQLATRTLWDVKTDDFEKQPPHSQRFFARIKLPEIKREKMLAEACGYKFVLGVKSPVHKATLLALDPDLTIVVMDWC
jgi:hypothetical protein